MKNLGGAKPGSQFEVTQDYASRAWPPTPIAGGSGFNLGGSNDLR